MEDRKEKNAPWLSVPQFGDWDQKGQVPDYSLDFSKIREMRKQNKREVSRASLGNEEEFINPTANTVSTTPSDDHHHNYPQNHHSPSVRFSLPLSSQILYLIRKCTINIQFSIIGW
uniref:RIN4 pathogenic type III effector avirulence factor Avr cleavage site domain-containing protein n=2 Tax=Gossypium TaxID=3633 RepID=A0A0D2RGS5_GOSRA|nr:hypothetical protein B456_003G047500 [Gossypium raimondii]